MLWTRMRWNSLPARPHDVDAGRLLTDSMMVVHASRPAHVTGPRPCCHPDDVEISFLERGTTYANVGGRDVVLRPGQYAVIAPGVEHCTHTRNEATRGLYVQLSRAFFDRAAEELRVRPWRTVDGAPHAVSPELHAMAAALKRESLASQAIPSMLEGLASYLTGCLLRAQSNLTARRADALNPAGTDRRLTRAVDLIHACLGDPLSLEEMATAASLSKFRFAHLFKAQYGVSPHRYHLRARVRSAAERLRTEDLPITELAHELGFASSSRFAAAFKQELGVPPSEWRASHLSPEGSKFRP